MFEILFVHLMLFLRNNDIENCVMGLYLFVTKDEDYCELQLVFLDLLLQNYVFIVQVLQVHLD